MKNEIIVRFLEFHVGGDDKLRIITLFGLTIYSYIASLPFNKSQNK